MNGPSRNLSLLHIAPALAMSGVATVLVAAWLLVGPRQAWIIPTYVTLLVGLAMFVVNAIYALAQFDSPIRSAANRRMWALAIVAGAPFFVLYAIALSVITVATVVVTNETAAPAEDLFITYPFSQTDEFDLAPGESRTFHIVPHLEGEVALWGEGVRETDVVWQCCKTTVEFVID